MRLNLERVSLDLGGMRIVEGADLTVDTGEVVGLVGPNGCGKSTTLRAVYRALRPVAGVVQLGDTDVWSLSAKDAARHTAVVTQENQAEFEFTVVEVVMLGRTPHKGPFERTTERDREQCRRSLSRVGMAGFEHRSFLSLSGGEKQRILVARALCQGSEILLLDEPTNHLDIRYQLEIMTLVRDLSLTINAALHDLNLAAAFCDRIYVMQQGCIVATGTPSDVLTESRILDVFGVRAHPLAHPVTGRLHLAFSQDTPTSGQSHDRDVASRDLDDNARHAARLEDENDDRKWHHSPPPRPR